MNNPRRIQRHLVKAFAAGALLAAAALPMALATAAGAAGPPVLTGFTAAAIGAGGTGSATFAGSNFANDGGNVSFTTTAAGVTFGTVAETGAGTGTVGTITTSATTVPGTYSVTLTDDNGTSQPLSGALTINADPTVTSISTTSVAQGQTTAGTTTITGTGFAAGTTASFTTTVNGTSLVNTFAYFSPTALTGTVSGSVTGGTHPPAVVGTYALTVTNTDGGTGTLASGVTVVASGITNVSPSEVPTTAGTYPVTIAGAGFEPTATVGLTACAGANATTSGTVVVSPSQVTTNIVIAAGAVAARCTVTVQNPAPPNGNNATISLAAALGVGEAATGGAIVTATALSPNSPIVPGTSGTVPETLTITGSGFGSGSTIQTFNGTSTTNDGAVTYTTSVNSTGTVITANVIVGSGAFAGTDAIAVLNNGVASAASANAFTVAGPALVSASPSALAINAPVGTVVTFTGTGLTGSGVITTPIAGGTGLAGVFAVTSPTTATFTVTTPPTAVGTGASIAESQTVSTGVTVSATPFVLKIDALPTVSSIVVTGTTSNTIGAGAVNVPVTITGANFNAGATVGSFVNAFGVADAGITFTLGTVTSTTITGTISIASTDANTSDGFKISNTDGGSVKAAAFGTAATLNIGPAPTITSVTPTSGAASATTSFEIAGTNFAAGAVVTLSPANGTCGVTTVSSSTTIAVTCTLGLAGTVPTSLVVTNPNGGSVTSSPVLAASTPAPPVFHVSGVHGAAVAGKWVTVVITGTGFYGQPKITSSAAGSKFAVSKDSGKALTVKVYTKPGLKGEHLLTVHLANGKSGKAGYNIKA